MNKVKRTKPSYQININSSYLKIFSAWLVAGSLGLFVTVVWLLVLLEGDTGGMASMVIMAFVAFYLLGHCILILPFFLIFWNRKTS